MSKIILGGRGGVLGGDYYAIFRITRDIARELGNDIESILDNDSGESPSGFLKKAYSQSSSKAVYYAPRNPNDGFPPRQNTLKDSNNFNILVDGKVSDFGFRLNDNVQLTQRYRYKHKSLFGKTKGKSVYPWIWIDEGTTWRNRFSGNPRNINQAFTRDWYSQGYRDIFINKMGTQLKSRGWDVIR